MASNSAGSNFWLGDLSSGDESPFDDEEEENDVSISENVEQSEHNTKSEQEWSESDEDSSLQEQLNERYFIGKDKTTKWKKMRPNLQTRVRSENIIKLLPGTKGDGRHAKTEIECLKLFITDAVIGVVTCCTNIWIQKNRNEYKRDRDTRDTNETEIRAVIGILFLIGTFKSSRKNTHKIWDNTRGNGIEACYLAMSEKRFRFLLRSLRFDDYRTRNERREIDKLAPIRELFEIFLNNFQNNFIPSEYLTVDEQLLAFRGRCAFKQYIPSKPAKYGIKTFALVDAKTFYTLNLEPYVGTQPDGPFKFKNNGEDVTLRMVQPVEGTKRNITGDNWFTSLSLVNNLKNKKLTYTGTIRKNRREVPSEFLPKKNREEYSSIFGFQEGCTIVSYCQKKNRCVILLSSMHNDNAIDPNTGPQKKPEIITDYNHTKIGVDMVDQLCQNYDVARNTRRWPMVIFYDLLNISGINGLCVYKANNSEKVTKRSNFIEQFAWELIRPQIAVRATIQQLPKADHFEKTRSTRGERSLSAPYKSISGSESECDPFETDGSSSWHNDYIENSSSDEIIEHRKVNENPKPKVKAIEVCNEGLGVDSKRAHVEKKQKSVQRNPCKSCQNKCATRLSPKRKDLESLLKRKLIPERYIQEYEDIVSTVGEKQDELPETDEEDDLSENYNH
ncbi:piggyBac transposable element-derived protein 4-like [Eupeodes corollae]|uniref:piggyBac transposable element-derived protein 4-like n=1 Tax=Eupeodes corollae TaxID=290404 RepID=UPI0024938AFE|nr:piggyBac transposable element-derived protein 4-like [Eupeodes corollae]